MHTINVVTAAALGAAIFATSHVATAGQRSFVSTTGVDNPSCSPASPCRTFAAAITATSSGGEIIVLDSGGYGAVTIGKSVSIVAPSGVYAGVSVFSGDGIVISGTNLEVALRGLTINGLGGSRGIFATGSGTAVHVDDCVVSSMSNGGIVAVATRSLTVRDSTVRDNAGNGIEIVGGYASIENVRTERNGLGIYVTANAYASVSRSVVRENGAHGLIVIGINPGDVSQLSVDASEISDNAADGLEVFAQGAGREARLVVTRSTVQRNLGDGVLANVAGGVVRLDVGDNQIDANSSHGIEVFINATGTAQTRAWGNRVSQNGGHGFSNAPGAVFETIGNNIVRGNDSGDISGTITVQPGD